MTRLPIIPALWFLAQLLTAPAASAQTLSGVVRAADDRSPIAGAEAALLAGGSVLRTVGTDGRGRFEFRLESPGPFELRVRRIGYAERTLVIEPPISEDVEVVLVPAPVVLGELGAEGERERLEFTVWGRTLVTETGLLPSLGVGCAFVTIDSVAIRDPRLFLPEATARYEPARTLMAGYGIWRILEKWRVDDPVLQAEAWPCRPMVLVSHRFDFRFRRRPLPRPDAPPFAPGPPLRRGLPDAPNGPAAVGPDGRLAIGSVGRPFVYLLDPTLGAGEVIGLAEERAGRLTEATALGWIGDTLWVADAGAGRVVQFPPGGAEPIIRRASALADPLGPSAPYPGERLVPVPLPEGRWLVDRAAPDAPYPPRREHEPPGRVLLVLDTRWRLERWLTDLRPGPIPLARGLERPVQPLRDHPLYALAPDGSHLTVVDRRLEKAVFWNVYSVTRVTPGGDTLFHVERTAPLVRVSDRAFAGAIDELAEAPELVREFPNETIRRGLARGGIHWSPYHPPISAVVVGRDGSTWLRWPDDRSGTVRWDVLDAEGEPKATLTLDRWLRILGADEEGIWATSTDTTAVPEVIRMPLGRGR